MAELPSAAQAVAVAGLKASLVEQQRLIDLLGMSEGSKVDEETYLKMCNLSKRAHDAARTLAGNPPPDAMQDLDGQPASLADAVARGHRTIQWLQDLVKHGTSAETQENALAALVLLADDITHQSSKLLIGRMPGAIKDYVGIMGTKTHHGRSRTALLLLLSLTEGDPNTSGKKDNMAVMVNEGVIEEVLEIVSSNYFDLRNVALQLLYNIGLEGRHHQAMRDNNAIEVVMPLIDDFAPSAGKATAVQYTNQTLLLNALYALVKSDHNIPCAGKYQTMEQERFVKIIADTDCLPKLVHTFKFTANSELRTAATVLLAELSRENADVAEILMSTTNKCTNIVTNCVRYLTTRGHAGTSHVLDTSHTCKLIERLSSHCADYRTQFAEAGVVKELLALPWINLPANNALFTLVGLMRNNQEDIVALAMQENIIPICMEKLKMSVIGRQQRMNACMIIERLTTTNPANAAHLVAAGAVPLLEVVALGSQMNKERQRAVGALVALAKCAGGTVDVSDSPAESHKRARTTP